MNDTYELNIDALENSAGLIAQYTQELYNNIRNLRNIFNYVEANWQNSEGNDIESIMNNFNSCANELEGKIQPTLAELSKTLYSLASQSRQNQSRSF